MKPEILAPAGDFVSLQAAIDAGADAIYFGVKGINMRAGAKNFLLSDMKKLIVKCHDSGVKTYLALNTIVYESELVKIRKILDKAKAVGVDAVIAWDMAVIAEALKRKIEVHMSTQMSVANSSSLQMFKKMGIKRFVLARECSLTDVKKLQKVFGVELEVFVHGAMCVSVSGRCFLSQLHYGKSANRGECIQPCRREYQIIDKEEKKGFVVGNDYLLSPEDMCTLPFIDKIIDTGVVSLKIEGRNRSPEYVKSVVSAYRRAVDVYFERKGQRGFRKEFEILKKELVGDVKKVYNRGFSSGFYMGKPIDAWTDTYGSKALTRKEYVGYVVNYYPKVNVAEIKVESNEFSIGDEIMFQGPTTGVVSQNVKSLEVFHKQVDRALKGKPVAMKTDKLVRKNDKVYVIKKSV